MARIEGVDLPRNKRVEIGLRYLYGIGPTRSHAILEATQINPDTRVKDLTDAEVGGETACKKVHLITVGDNLQKRTLHFNQLTFRFGCQPKSVVLF